MDIQKFEMAGLGKYMASQQVDEMASELLEHAHAGERPLWMLEYIAAARAELDRLQDEWAKHARINGHSFTEIGEALGVSKQAAAKKYGKTE